MGGRGRGKGKDPKGKGKGKESSSKDDDDPRSATAEDVGTPRRTRRGKKGNKAGQGAPTSTKTDKPQPAEPKGGDDDKKKKKREQSLDTLKDEQTSKKAKALTVESSLTDPLPKPTREAEARVLRLAPSLTFEPIIYYTSTSCFGADYLCAQRCMVQADLAQKYHLSQIHPLYIFCLESSMKRIRRMELYYRTANPVPMFLNGAEIAAGSTLSDSYVGGQFLADFRANLEQAVGSSGHFFSAEFDKEGYLQGRHYAVTCEKLQRLVARPLALPPYDPINTPSRTDIVWENDEARYHHEFGLSLLELQMLFLCRQKAVPYSRAIRAVLHCRGFRNVPANRTQFTPWLQLLYDYPMTPGMGRLNLEMDRRGPTWIEWRDRLQNDASSPFTGIFTLESVAILKARLVADAKLVGFSLYNFRASRPNVPFPTEGLLISEFNMANFEQAMARDGPQLTFRADREISSDYVAYALESKGSSLPCPVAGLARCPSGHRITPWCLPTCLLLGGLQKKKHGRRSIELQLCS